MDDLIPHPVLARLSPHLAGPLSAYGDAFVVAGGPHLWSPGTALLDRDVLADRLRSFAAPYREPEMRAVATQWSKQHFARLLVPFFGANLLLGRALPVDLGAISVSAGPDGRTIRFLTDPASERASGTGRSRFDAVVEGHLRPLIDGLSRASSLSPRVLWSNAGNLVEQVVRTIERAPEADPDGMSAARDLLGDRPAEGQGPSPLASPVRYLGEPPRRVRRVCCLRYLIAELTLCGTCPIQRRPT